MLGSDDEMVVTWTTFSPAKASIAQYGTKLLNQQVNGTVTKYLDIQSNQTQRTYYINRAHLTSLLPGVQYCK